MFGGVQAQEKQTVTDLRYPEEAAGRPLAGLFLSPIALTDHDRIPEGEHVLTQQLRYRRPPAKTARFGAFLITDTVNPYCKSPHPAGQRPKRQQQKRLGSEIQGRGMCHWRKWSLFPSPICVSCQIALLEGILAVQKSGYTSRAREGNAEPDQGP